MCLVARTGTRSEEPGGESTACHFSVPCRLSNQSRHPSTSNSYLRSESFHSFQVGAGVPNKYAQTSYAYGTAAFHLVPVMVHLSKDSTVDEANRGCRRFSAHTLSSFTRDLFLPLRTDEAKLSNNPRNLLASKLSGLSRTRSYPTALQRNAGREVTTGPVGTMDEGCRVRLGNWLVTKLPALPIDAADTDGFSGSTPPLITKSCRSAIPRNSGT
jgi:hypothetical protein